MSPLKLLLFTPPAHEYTAGTLPLTQLWARATPPVPPVCASHVMIINGGSAPNRLLSCLPIVECIEVYESTTTDGVTRKLATLLTTLERRSA